MPSQATDNANWKLEFENFKHEMKSKVRGEIDVLKHGQKTYGTDLSDDEKKDPSFVQLIMDEPIPPKFKILTFKIYEGVIDPVEHVEMFEAIIDFHVVLDAIKCRAFQIYLRGAAKN